MSFGMRPPIAAEARKGQRSLAGRKRQLVSEGGLRRKRSTVMILWDNREPLVVAHSKEHDPDHSLERLVFFSDAVFAIAITLLIIEVHVPHLPNDASNADWGRALIQLLPNFAAFALSFLVIGVMWAAHHTTMSYLSRYSPRLLWPNLLLLMTVAFLPFSTALLAMGGSAQLPNTFYAGSLLVAALCKTRLTLLALKPDLLRPDADPQRIAIERRRAWIMPVATLLALALTFTVATHWAMAAMVLIAFFRRLPWFRMPRV
jgi:uncharacterized membrane protein